MVSDYSHPASPLFLSCKYNTFKSPFRSLILKNCIPPSFSMSIVYPSTFPPVLVSFYPLFLFLLLYIPPPFPVLVTLYPSTLSCSYYFKSLHPFLFLLLYIPPPFPVLVTSYPSTLSCSCYFISLHPFLFLLLYIPSPFSCSCYFYPFPVLVTLFFPHPTLTLFSNSCQPKNHASHILIITQ